MFVYGSPDLLAKTYPDEDGSFGLTFAAPPSYNDTFRFYSSREDLLMKGVQK